jgi:hypothetical protein
MAPHPAATEEPDTQDLQRHLTEGTRALAKAKQAHSLQFAVGCFQLVFWGA